MFQMRSHIQRPSRVNNHFGSSSMALGPLKRGGTDQVRKVPNGQSEMGPGVIGGAFCARIHGRHSAS